MRDMDVAAAVIGIRPIHAKLSAFAVSSFFVGLAGGLWGFVHLGSWEPAAFSIDRSFQLLFMVIIGGLGSIMGSFFGAAFIVLLPLFINQVPAMLGMPISTALAAHLEAMVFGALIVFSSSSSRMAWRDCGPPPRKNCACGPSRTDILTAHNAAPRSHLWRQTS